MIAQALCGINAFAFFSSNLIDKGLPTSDAIYLLIGVGAVGTAFGLFTAVISDKFGRTVLVLIALPIISVLLFILAGIISMDITDSSRKGAIFFVCLGVVLYLGSD